MREKMKKKNQFEHINKKKKVVSNWINAHLSFITKCINFSSSSSME